MPELPEVETVRRGLEPVMAGHRLVRVEQRRADLRFPFPDQFVERLTGARVECLSRRAKYLLAQLSTGETLVMHLGMSGRFSISPSPRISKAEGRSEGQPGPAGSRQGARAAARQPSREGATPPADQVSGRGSGSRQAAMLGAYVHDTGNEPTHDHVVLHMSGGAVITYNDPRRFGFMQLVPADALDAHPLFAALGVEPLGNALTADYIASRATGRRTDLKAFLLDQRIVAGLGNIYVCEVLFRAGLSPRRGASCLADRKGRPTERAARLVPVIRQVLEEAIAAGGSTLRDYKHTDGSLGYFQHTFAVYGREGEPCPRPGCGGTVRRLVQAGRSSFYCARCQG